MHKAPLLLMALLLAQTTNAATALEFRAKGGAAVNSAGESELSKYAPSETLKVWQPEESREATYRGYDAVKVFQAVFGQAWNQAELALFVCADGYRAPVPTVLFQNAKALIAVEKPGKPFTVDNAAEHKKDIPLGPFYLVWDNLHHPEVKAEGATNWPYQVVAIELANFKDKFPHMIPSPKASAGVQRGFHSFQKYCMTCHMIRGDGGSIGPDLSKTACGPKRAAYIEKWVADPAKLKPGTTMPALTRTIKNRTAVIASLADYLVSLCPIEAN